MTRVRAFLVLLVVQAGCAGVFLLDIVMSIFGLYPAPLAWSSREFLEMGAALGLILGVVFGGALVWGSFSRLRTVEAQLNLASGAFMEMLNLRFTQWGLTAAERDVALFAIKGMNVQEIAQLRETSEGTVKSQTAAIYRKAGVSGRPQLLSLFIEDMMGAGRSVTDSVEVFASKSQARV
jgi:DNA-binding CsgD family transcriptional regulator